MIFKIWYGFNVIELEASCNMQENSTNFENNSIIWPPDLESLQQGNGASGISHDYVLFINPTNASRSLNLCEDDPASAATSNDLWQTTASRSRGWTKKKGYF